MKHQIEAALQRVKPIVIGFGDYSLDVMRLQKAMHVLGFYLGSVDGYFGTLTLDALTRMQEYLDIEPSHKFDLATWESLNYWLPSPLHRRADYSHMVEPSDRLSLRRLQSGVSLLDFALS